MHLQSSDTLGGQPVTAVRRLMRAWCGECTDPIAVIREVLPLSPLQAKALYEVLLRDGLLETRLSDGKTVLTDRTAKGGAFACATFAKPLHRSTVEKKLAELVERMVVVNTRPEFLVGIERADVFGSYLTNAERLGDLDINLFFWIKEADKKRYRALANKAASESGRTFSNILERLYWPQTQTRLFLKQRSRVYSLHSDEDLLERDPSVPRRPIFLDRKPVAAP